jgi:hypothetical protein
VLSAQLRYVSCHALVDCCILSDYKTVKESEAAFCEHHASFFGNTFSPQIGSAFDNQSNNKSTTIPVAEHQDYTTTLVELTTGISPVHAATYTGRNGIITDLFVRGNLTADAPKAQACWLAGWLPEVPGSSPSGAAMSMSNVARKALLDAWLAGAARHTGSH